MIVARARTLLRHPAVGALLLWAAFIAGRRELWGNLTRLPPDTFEGTSILARALVMPLQGVAFAVCIGFAVVLGRKLTWSDIGPASDDGRRQARTLRLVVLVLVGAAAWVASLYEYNLLVDRAHVIDRLVVIALAVLAVWRPAFVPAFLVATLLVIAQASVALNALGWTNMRLFLDALMLFSCFIVLHRVVGVPLSSFVFVLMAVVGAAYFGPAIDKVEVGPDWWTWHTENDVANIAAAGYANGWLPWLGDDTAATLVRGLSTIAPVLGMGTFIIEAIGLLVFAHRRVAFALCIGVIALHTGIFVLTGILFWKWILVDAGVALFMWRHGAALFAVWPWWMRVLGTLAIAFAPLTFAPQQLAWWDTRLNQVMTVEVQDDDGAWHPMSPLTYAPFDLPFAQQRFTELLDVPKKVGTFGATSSVSTYRKLQSARTKADVERVFRSARPAFDEKRARLFDKFIVRTAQTLNRHGGDPPLGWLPHAPAHIIVVRHDPWDGQPITAARVRLKEVFFDGTRFVTFDDRIVRTIDVPAVKGAPPPEKAVRDLSVKPTHTVIDRGAEMVMPDACALAPDVVAGTVHVALLADMKLHKPLSEQALKKGYDSLWSEVKPFIRAADVAYANLEGTIACCMDGDGKERPDPGLRWDNLVYTSSNKGLNFHPGLAAALADLGVDVVSTANNHSLDRLAFGAMKTLDVLDAANVKHSGTRRDENEPWHTITEARGMRIAWLACAEWTNKKDKDAAEHVLNCTEERDEVLALTRTLAADPKIDAVFVTPHGSVEDHVLPDERLRTLANELAEAGATVVASSHPHNLQTWQMKVTQDGRRVPLVYGRGNYITFANGIENITSTIVHVGLVRAPNGKAMVRGVVHTPIYLVPEEGNRRLIFVREGDMDAAGAAGADRADAWRIITQRFGTARLHPPTTPIDVTPECGPASSTTASRPAPAGGVGDICIDDTMCAVDLLCAPHADAIGLCTRACGSTSDANDACPEGSACVDDAVLGARVCLQACTSDDACRLETACEAHGGAKVCAPHAPKTK